MQRFKIVDDRKIILSSSDIDLVWYLFNNLLEVGRISKEWSSIDLGQRNGIEIFKPGRGWTYQRRGEGISFMAEFDMLMLEYFLDLYRGGKFDFVEYDTELSRLLAHKQSRGVKV